MEDEIEKLVQNAKEILDKDPNEAGMLLYNAAEKAIILLAKKFVPEIYKQAEEKGSWSLFMLFSVAEEASKKLDKKIKEYWYEAWELRVESKQYGLSKEFLSKRLVDIEKLIKIIKKHA